MKKNIIVFVAHSDDEVLGAGGTIAKYAQEGYKVYTIICSFGESSHPHLRPEVIKKMRVQEAEKADRLLGGSGVKFLGLKEFQFGKEIERGRTFSALQNRFKKLKPEKVFTHDMNDSHPDHQAASEIVLRIRKKISFELFTFHVSTIINRRQGKTPMLYVDISAEFKKKIAALHIFKSQFGPLNHTQTNNILYLGVYFKAIVAGVRLRTRYAEVFHKL